MATRTKKLLVGASLAGALVFGVTAGTGFAQDDDSDDDDGVVVVVVDEDGADADSGANAESYPPKKPSDPGDPGRQARKLPATGSDGTEMWLRVGAATLLAGGLLVAGTSRRRQTADT